MTWFTTRTVKIASLWMKVNILVSGLDFTTKWANNYAIGYCLYPEPPYPAAWLDHYHLQKRGSHNLLKGLKIMKNLLLINCLTLGPLIMNNWKIYGDYLLKTIIAMMLRYPRKISSRTIRRLGCWILMNLPLM